MVAWMVKMIFFDALQCRYEVLESVYDNVLYIWLEKYTLIRGLWWFVLPVLVV